MSASLRFLAIALVGWAGVRAASLGMIPGVDGFSFSYGEPARAAAPAVPTIAQTEFPPLDAPPPAALDPAQLATSPAQQMFVPAAMPRAVPYFYYPAAMPQPMPVREISLPSRPARSQTVLLPEPAPLFYSPLPQLDDWPLSRMASAALPARRSSTTLPQQSAPEQVVKAKLDRLQLTAWALLRQQGLAPAPSSLASTGTLGASQAGARLTYNFTPAIAASLRTSSTVGRRGGEVAAGVRLTPFRSVPVSLTAERRQAIGRFGGGRSAFALFLEGGIYDVPVRWGFNLDGYAQAGVVGLRRRDLFVDGGFTLTRPLFGRFSAGAGVWGGVQPGLYRIDAGPRVSMKVRNNMRVHLDWRQRVAGNAEPGSGPAVTLAADF